MLDRTECNSPAATQPACSGCNESDSAATGRGVHSEGSEPTWRLRNKLTARRVRLWTFSILFPLPAMTILAFWLATGDGKFTLGINWMFMFGSVGGICAVLISTSSASSCRRPLASVDVIRMVCWTLVGFGLASACGYSPFGVCMTLIGLAVVVFTAFIPSPAPPADPVMCCGRCGYNLTGNVSGTCPECGQPVTPAARST